MGGMAFLIWGELSEPKLKPVPIKRTFLDRVMGRQRFDKPHVTDMGGGRRFIDFPAQKYLILREDFRNFLQERIPEPWPATRSFLHYLKGDVLEVYLRGEQSPELSGPEYYIQISFSGCAGMAEISAELGTHWAEIYYRSSHERIKDEYLNHFGFAPDDERTLSEQASPFLPLGSLGYAKYVGNRGDETDAEWEGSRLFELDASVSDTYYERGDLSALRELDNRYGPLMADGKCRCQLCMPDLDLASIGELPPAGSSAPKGSYESSPTFYHGRVRDGGCSKGEMVSPFESRRSEALFIPQSPRRSHGVLHSAENFHDSLWLVGSRQAMKVHRGSL